MKAAAFEEWRDFLPELVRKLEREVPYAAVFAARREGVRVMVSSTQTQVLPEHPHPGLCVTLWNGECFFEFSTDRLEPDFLKEESLALARRAASLRQSRGLELDPGPSLEKDFATPCRLPGTKVTLKEKLAWTRELQRDLAKLSNLTRNAVVVCGDLEIEEIFVNRRKNLRQRLARYDELAQIYVGDGKRVQPLWDGNSLAGGWEHRGFLKPRLKALAADAERLLRSKRLDPGFYDIVTDPAWSGILAHEAFGHGMETDMFLKDRARGKEYLGKKVASEWVSLYDDPSLPGQAGTFFFDHEGELARPNLIIDRGILKAGMTDLRSASLLGLARSANGRRESWERKAYARMTNTYFAPGPFSPEEILASVEDGVYLRHPSNGMEDPKGWGIQCEGLWAQRICGGKLSEEVFGPVIMTGFVPDILQSISMVGNDLRIFGSGFCGKGHKEYIKNTTGGPHLRLRARLA